MQFFLCLFQSNFLLHSGDLYSHVTISTCIQKNINRLNGQLQIKCKYKIRRFKLSSTSTSVGFKLILDVLFFWLKSFFWSSLHDSSTIKLEKSILFITLCFQKVLSLSIFQIIRRASASELWESFYETNIVNPDVS